MSSVELRVLTTQPMSTSQDKQNLRDLVVKYLTSIQTPIVSVGALRLATDICVSIHGFEASKVDHPCIENVFNVLREMQLKGMIDILTPEGHVAGLSEYQIAIVNTTRDRLLRRLREEEEEKKRRVTEEKKVEKKVKAKPKQVALLDFIAETTKSEEHAQHQQQRVSQGRVETTIKSATQKPSKVVGRGKPKITDYL